MPTPTREWQNRQNKDGSYTIGPRFGGLFVQTKEGKIELRFPFCSDCPNYPFSAVDPEPMEAGLWFA